MGERRSKWMGCCGEATLCQYAMDSYNTWCYDMYHFILFVWHLDYHDDNLITNQNRYQPAELVQSFFFKVQTGPGHEDTARGNM